MSIQLPAKAILALDDHELSEHNRAPLQIAAQEIGNSSRTVDGTLRSYVTRRPLTVTASWENLPSRSPVTVDGYWGGMEIQEFYTLGPLVFKVGIYADQEADRLKYAPTYEFMGKFTTFDFTINKRNVEGIYYDFWTVNLTIEEV